MKTKASGASIITAACLIAGNLVGAGILALPSKTGLAGFVPSLVGMASVGAAMFLSALILSREAIEAREASFNYPSLYGRYLGRAGKWLAILTNLLILYGLMTAYLAGAVTIIGSLFDLQSRGTWILFGFFLLITALNTTGIRIVQRYNLVLMALMWLSFAVIVAMGETHAVPARLRYTDWRFLPATLPIMVTAFHFHNIIPQVCQGLEWDRAAIWKTMLAGMLIGYAMNAIWIQVAVGALPLSGSADSLLTAFDKNLPATVPLAAIVDQELFHSFSLLFALLAISTSYLATGAGLMGFIADLTKNHARVSAKWLVVGLSFGPPLAIAWVYPDIFLATLDLVGGVGIVLLFGILPGIIALMKSRKPRIRLIYAVMLLVFGVALAVEIGQEAGLLHIRPEVEYWRHNVGVAANSG